MGRHYTETLLLLNVKHHMRQPHMRKIEAIRAPRFSAPLTEITLTYIRSYI